MEQNSTNSKQSDKTNGKLRIAAVADIHVRENDKGKWTDFFKDISRNADVLLL